MAICFCAVCDSHRCVRLADVSAIKIRANVSQGNGKWVMSWRDHHVWIAGTFKHDKWITGNQLPGWQSQVTTIDDPGETIATLGRDDVFVFFRRPGFVVWPGHFVCCSTCLMIGFRSLQVEATLTFGRATSRTALWFWLAKCDRDLHSRLVLPRSLACEFV